MPKHKTNPQPFDKDSKNVVKVAKFCHIWSHCMMTTAVGNGIFFNMLDSFWQMSPHLKCVFNSFVFKIRLLFRGLCHAERGLSLIMRKLRDEKERVRLRK